jgi:uncharacterized protein
MPWSLRMLLFITLASSLFHFYVARKSIKAIAALTGWPKKRIRVTTLALLTWVVLYPLLMIGSYYLKLGGVTRALQQANSALDLFVTYPFWAGIILAVQVSLLFLLIDLARLLLFPIYRKNKARWLRAEAIFVVAIISLGSLYVVGRIYSDTFTLRTREKELKVANLPAELNGFRIVQIADLQADPRTGDGKLRPYIDLVNGMEPDLILFGGDLVTSGTDYIEEGAEAMGQMRARFGTYACLGDHDYFSNPDMVKSNLEKNGVTVLPNVATVVPVGTTFVSLTGVTQVYRSPVQAATLEAIEKQRVQGPVNIFLTHQPSDRLVSFAADKRYDLFVAGHTHGGQIVFPLPGFLLTGSSFETSYVSGFYNIASMMVSINNGLGLTLAPVRYHAPAEVTLITLRPAD